MTDKCADCGHFRGVMEHEAVGFCEIFRRVVAKIEAPCDDFDADGPRAEVGSLNEFGKSMVIDGAESEFDVPRGKWATEVRKGYE